MYTNNSIGEIKTGGFKNKTSDFYDDQFLVSIVLRYEDRFLFIKPPMVQEDLTKWVPIFIEAGLMGNVEEDIAQIKRLFFKSFKFEPVQIRISYNCITLKPVLNTNFYLSVVDIEKDHYMKLRSKFGEICIGDLFLYKDLNLFFGFISQEY